MTEWPEMAKKNWRAKKKPLDLSQKRLQSMWQAREEQLYKALCTGVGKGMVDPTFKAMPPQPSLG